MTRESPWGGLEYVNAYPAEALDYTEKPIDPGAWGEWQKIQVGAGAAEVDYVTEDLILAYHPQQWAALVECEARFRVIAAGVGWGKTIGLSQYLTKKAITEPGVYWWVAPTYALATIAQVDYFDKIIPPSALAEPFKKSERCYIFRNGSRIYLKSADDPKKLVGQRLKGFVFDEAARALETAWTDGLRGRLTGSNRDTWGIFISSANGHDWFYRLLLRGKDPSEREWESFRFGTAGNPMIDPKELASAKRDLPLRFYLQNYESEFFADGAGMFPNLGNQLRPMKTGHPLPGRFYVHGNDIALDQDFNVTVSYDASDRMPVDLDRCQKLGPDATLQRIVDQVKKYRQGQLWADDTAMGGKLAVNELTKKGITVRGYTLTNDSKRELINAYQLAIERGKIFIPCDGPWGEIYVEEHKSFRLTMTPRGTPIFSAPPGYNDDCVLAGAIASYGLQSSPVSGANQFLVGSGTGDKEGRERWPGEGL